jgi:hypothetical protein
VAGDLLRPTLQGYVSRTGVQPWRLGSQAYVALLGGVLAVTPIAFLNARMLRAPTRVRAGILAIGAAGFAAVIAAAALLLSGDSAPDGAGTALTLFGVVAWGGMFLLQRPYDRIYSTFSQETDADDLYDSLLPAGFTAVLLGFIAQNAIVAAVTG